MKWQFYYAADSLSLLPLNSSPCHCYSRKIAFCSLKVGYTQCLANAMMNLVLFRMVIFSFSFWVLYGGVVIWLLLKLNCCVCLLWLFYDIKNNIRNSRQVPTCILWTNVLSKSSFKIFLFIFLDKWVSGKESNLVRLCWWMTSLQSACFILFWLELF